MAGLELVDRLWAGLEWVRVSVGGLWTELVKVRVIGLTVGGVRVG